MADEPAKTEKQLAAEKAQQELAAQLAANADCQKKYQGMVGKRYTNGKQIAEVTGYVPSRLTTLAPGKAEARQCFVVNFGHRHVSFYRPCKEFSEEFASDAAADAVQVIDMNPVNLPQ